MIHRAIDPNVPKGWFLGPWNSPLAVPVGYANRSIDEWHLHEQMYEIYLPNKNKAEVQGKKDN